MAPIGSAIFGRIETKMTQKDVRWKSDQNDSVQQFLGKRKLVAHFAGSNQFMTEAWEG
jgi:hypothetical protein